MKAEGDQELLEFKTPEVNRKINNFGTNLTPLSNNYSIKRVMP